MSAGTTYETVILTKSITLNLTVTDVVLDDISGSVVANQLYPDPLDPTQNLTIKQVFNILYIQNLGAGIIRMNIIEDPNNQMTFTTGLEPGTLNIPDTLDIGFAGTIRRLRFFKTSGSTVNFQIILQKTDK